MEDSLKFISLLLNLPLIAVIMARVGGLVMFAPFFSSGAIPVKVRVFLTATITLIVAPFVGASITVPAHFSGLVTVIFSELLVGLVFGFGLLAIFTALELGGLMMGQQMGIALAHVFDPLFDTENSVLGQLYFWLAMVIFLVIGGHHAVLGAVIRSFTTLPVGSFVMTAEILSLINNILQTAFVVALQVAAPIIVTIFLATLAMGFVTRTVPQLNILSIGFAVRSMLGFALAVVCIAAAVDLFVNVLDRVFTQLQWLFAF